MRFVKIKKEEVLFIECSSDSSMYILGECLTADISYNGGSKRVQWIKNEHYQAGASNLTFMEKEDGNILLGNLFDEDPYEHALVVPIPVMIDLLEQWDAVCKNLPTEVTVYYEDAKFRVEGVYEKL